MFENRPDQPDSTTATRQRLLEAAGEVFAERGYHDATVREICGKAGANVAAVSYYFGDKSGLYAAVLRYAHQCAAADPVRPAAAPPGDAGPEERLGLFVHGLLWMMFEGGRMAWRGKLMAREMIEPTGALDGLVREEILPMAEVLWGIVRELLGPAAGDEQVRRCGNSVVGQCFFYRHAQPVLQRLFPGQVYDAPELGRLAEHITRFSLAGIRAEAPAAGRGERP